MAQQITGLADEDIDTRWRDPKASAGDDADATDPGGEDGTDSGGSDADGTDSDADQSDS